LTAALFGCLCPAPFPGPVMSRILELIPQWKDGICSELC
jgi:hypothetical protein